MPETTPRGQEDEEDVSEIFRSVDKRDLETPDPKIPLNRVREATTNEKVAQRAGVAASEIEEDNNNIGSGGTG